MILDCTVCGNAPGVWKSRTDRKYYACDDCFSAAEHLRRYRCQPDNGVIVNLQEHEECGRWDNGRLVKHCRKSGTEDCAFCPYLR